MKNFKLILLVKIFLSRFWRNMRGPVVEVDIEEMVDRLGKKIARHELLKLLENQGKKEGVIFYNNYNKKMSEIQDGKWLIDFIGKSKSIPYWITPWGGCVKDYSRKRLTIPYSKEYIKGLRAIRDSIRINGYQVDKYGYITGQLLLNKGERKFIIWNGHRRALSLASLGFKKVKVEISGGDRWDGNIGNHIISLKNLSRWKNTKNSLYTEDEARIFLNRYFISLGSLFYFFYEYYQSVI